MPPKLRELERRCDATLAKFEEQARETIEKIAAGAEQKKASAQAWRNVSRAKRELREAMEENVVATRGDGREGAAARLKIEEGVRVRLKGVREPARVRRLIGDDEIEVQAGFLKMRVGRDEVVEVLPDAEDRKLLKGVPFQPGPEAYTSVWEINVIGTRAEEVDRPGG